VPSWIYRVQQKGKVLAYKRFPFTEKGEKDAGLGYLQRLELLEMEPRNSIKRRTKGELARSNDKSKTTLTQ
jgi:hypothetical protein